MTEPTTISTPSTLVEEFVERVRLSWPQVPATVALNMMSTQLLPLAIFLVQGVLFELVVRRLSAP